MYSMEIRVVKRKRRHVKLRLALLPALALLTLFGALLNSRFRAAFAAVAAERVNAGVAEQLNIAVSETIAAFPGESMLSVTQTGEESFLIIADTARLSAVSSAVTAKAQRLIDKAGDEGASVELGTVSGLSLLTGRGPRMGIRFTPLGSVKGDIISSLRSSGINQSLFTVELKLTASVRVILAGHDETVTVKTTVPLCETVVVGKVPQVYTNVANEDDMLNLIPTDVP